MQISRILFVTALSAGSLGVAMASGCSSSSGTPAGDSGAAEETSSGSSGSSSGSSTSSSSSSSSSSGGGFACMNATGCTAPQVCCLQLAGTTPGTVCAASPCPAIALLGGPVQICSTDAECGVGMACGTPTNAILAMGLAAMGGKACIPGEGGAPPADGGTVKEGGSTDSGSSSSSGGDSGSETGTADAPAG
jgi:hypothetical protein